MVRHPLGRVQKIADVPPNLFVERAGDDVVDGFRFLVAEEAKFVCLESASSAPTTGTTYRVAQVSQTRAHLGKGCEGRCSAAYADLTLKLPSDVQFQTNRSTPDRFVDIQVLSDCRDRETPHLAVPRPRSVAGRSA